MIGAFRNFELNQLAIEKRPGRAFSVEENVVPAYDELILIANKEQIDDSKLRRFVDALEEGRTVSGQPPGRKLGIVH